MPCRTNPFWNAIYHYHASFTSFAIFYHNHLQLEYPHQGWSVVYTPLKPMNIIKKNVAIVGQLGVGKHSLLSNINDMKKNHSNNFPRYSSIFPDSTPWIVNILIRDSIVSLSIYVFDGTSLVFFSLDLKKNLMN